MDVLPTPESPKTSILARSVTQDISFTTLVFLTQNLFNENRKNLIDSIKLIDKLNASLQISTLIHDICCV